LHHDQEVFLLSQLGLSLPLCVMVYIHSTQQTEHNLSTCIHYTLANALLPQVSASIT